jgi:hypothetical protein
LAHSSWLNSDLFHHFSITLALSYLLLHPAHHIEEIYDNRKWKMMLYSSKYFHIHADRRIFLKKSRGCFEADSRRRNVATLQGFILFSPIAPSKIDNAFICCLYIHLSINCPIREEATRNIFVGENIYSVYERERVHRITRFI